jgi:serralysin
VYYVDDLNDRVVEANGEGSDTVFTTGSFTLSPSTYAEVLAVTNAAITTSLSLGGNQFNNLILAAAGNDFIDGGAGNDTLYGFGGNDTMEGGTGNDILVGGAGNDIYYLSAAGDVIIEAASGGTDTAFTTVSYSLAAGAEVETLAVFNAASTTGLALTGNEFNNQILATAGGDTLNGTTGNDTLYGFGGSDVYYVDSTSDVVVEAASGGTDTVFSTGSYSLAFTSEIEVLAIANSAATTAFTLGGNEFANQLLAAAGNDSLDGDAGNDTLYAFAGNDTLNGGVGNDAMIGGAGNDTYYVDSAFDSVQEASGEGTDVVFTSVSFSATGVNEIEVIAASNAASTIGLSLGGNAIANQLLATAGNDTLNGGAGVDTMYGFGGNDTYYIDDAGDVVIEAASGGTDTVFTSVSYSLTFGAEIEVIAAANSASTTGIGLVGNAFNNQLLGTAGGDTLNGDTGNDTLYGFGGNDIYYVDSTSDIVVEAAGAGLDTIFTSGSYTLAGTSEVEILAASNAASTTGLVLGGNEFDNQVLATAGNDTLTGNAGNDTLYGFGGNDILTGGLGNDFLVGGSGSDIFVLGEQFGGSTFDTITDYNVADDQIQLNSAAFAGLSAGALAGNAFTIGTAATTADHRIIYDNVSGNLLYDADGNGAASASIFANIGAGLAMNAGEFLVV